MPSAVATAAASTALSPLPASLIEKMKQKAAEAAKEPKPGIDPSAAYLGQVLGQLKSRPAAMVLRVSYQSPRASEWIASQATMKAVVLPYTVGGSERAKDRRRRVSAAARVAPRGLGAVEPIQVDGHQERSGLVVGNLTRCDSPGEGLPLPGSDASAIPLSCDETLCDH